MFRRRHLATSLTPTSLSAFFVGCQSAAAHSTLTHACHATRHHTTQDSDFAHTTLECARGCHLRFSKHLQASSGASLQTILRYSAQLSALQFLSINDSLASTQDHVAVISKCPSLRVLHVAGTDINNNMVASIARLRCLEEVSLVPAGVSKSIYWILFCPPQSNVRLEVLAACKTLRRLTLSDIDDKGLAAIVQLPHLEEFYVLRSCATTVAPLAACKSLKVLHIGKYLDDTELAALTQLPLLEKLVAWGCTFKIFGQDGYPRITSLAPLGACKLLKTLTLDADCLDDKAVAALAQLPLLEELRLRGATANSFAPFGACKSLKVLSLDDSNIDDGGVAAIGGLPSLVELYISCGVVRSFAPLGRCKTLKNLNLDRIELEYRGILAIAQLPLLEVLCISNCKSSAPLVPLGMCKALKKLRVTNIDQTEFAAIVQLPLLEDLSISDCESFTSFIPLGACKRLRNFSVIHTSIDSKGVSVIATQLPLLEELSLRRCASVTSLAPLAACKSLTSLDFSWTNVDNEGLAAVAKLPRLKDVCMSCCFRVTSFAPLGACKA